MKARAGCFTALFTNPPARRSSGWNDLRDPCLPAAPFTAYEIFRNCTSPIKEWLGTVKPVALLINAVRLSDPHALLILGVNNSQVRKVHCMNKVQFQDCYSC